MNRPGLRGKLQQLIHDLGVTRAVKLLGWKQQGEILESFYQAHLFLAPSVTAKDGDQEGTPTVLLQAMATGLPVVSTVHSGIPEMVQDGVSGFLVPERDVDALTEKVAYLIEHPEILPPHIL